MIMNKISRIALSATLVCGIFASCQISSDEPQGPAGPSDIAKANLVAYIDFESQATDQITGASPIKIGSGVTYTSGHHGLGKALKGSPSGGLVYDAAALGLDKASSFSVAMWFKQAPVPSSTRGLPCFYTMTDGQDLWGTYTFCLERGGTISTDSLSVKVSIQDGYVADYGLNRGLPADRWVHVVTTWDGKAKVLHTYVDGAIPADFAKAEQAFNASFAKLTSEVKYPSIKYLVIGQWGQKALGTGTDESMGDVEGAIDEFRVYNIALSATQVRALYDAESDMIP